MVKKLLGNLELFCGLAGMACPVPVVGEVLLSGFFYPIVKEIPCFSSKHNENKFPAIATSLCVAGLARFPLYQQFYEPMLDYIQKFL
jgi:hypothetical protein